MGLSKEDKEQIIKFCIKHNIPHETGWRNFTNSIELPESIVLDIDSEEQAVEFVKFVLKLNNKKSIANTITYRAVAAGESRQRSEPRYDRKSYSMTSLLEADVLLRLCGEQFHDIQLLDPTKHLVSVGPSVQMGDLDTRLYYKHGLVLPTSTLIPWVTIGGSATGTHGTGRDQPSIPGLIRRLRILRPDGKIVVLDKNHPDFATIIPAHLGLFGIVLEIDLECRPAMKLEITTEVTNIYYFKERIKQGLYKNNEYVSVANFIDGEKDEGAKDASKDLIIITWKPVPLSTPDKGNCAQLEYMSQRFTIFMQESFQINALLKKHPQLVTAFKQYIVAPLAVAGQNKTIVVPWPDGAHYQRAFPYDLDDEDDIFPVSDDCHEFLDALDFTVKAFNKRAAGPKPMNPLLYALYYRYFEGTNGGLSTSAHGEGQHVVGFDMTSARNMPGFEELKTEIREYLMKNYGAKPHHGKTVPANADYAKIYGDGYYDFIKALRKWANDCKLDLNTWPHMNKFFMHHLGIDKTLPDNVDATLPKEEPPININHASSQALAQSVLAVLDEHDEHCCDDPSGKHLHDRLETLAGMKMVISGNTSTVFQPHEESKSESELKEEPAKKKKGCCTIL